LTTEEELEEFCERLTKAAKSGESVSIVRTLKKLEEAGTTVAKAFSGSWLGYHACVYYQNFCAPPAGAQFSVQWGLFSIGRRHSSGNWQVYEYDAVKEHIYELAGHPNIEAARTNAKSAGKLFEEWKREITSIIEIGLSKDKDVVLQQTRDELKNLQTMSTLEVANQWHSSRHVLTSDYQAMNQGTKMPPHIEVLGEIASIRHSFEICEEAARICKRLLSHHRRKAELIDMTKEIAKFVFIGHGRSTVWRDLKDFLKERLGLETDEFNRIPTAGKTTVERLSEMLDSASFAFLVLTGEDERNDKTTQARMNVIHETGLFQGRLGFSKAIVLLEEDCAEFSNIHGLTQIRFPKGNIQAKFEEIRRTLEAAGLINPVSVVR